LIDWLIETDRHIFAAANLFLLLTSMKGGQWMDNRKKLIYKYYWMSVGSFVPLISCIAYIRLIQNICMAMPKMLNRLRSVSS
jgi:hypothetical protein